jgi:hypothetical protein
MIRVVGCALCCYARLILEGDGSSYSLLLVISGQLSLSFSLYQKCLCAIFEVWLFVLPAAFVDGVYGEEVVISHHRRRTKRFETGK